MSEITWCLKIDAIPYISLIMVAIDLQFYGLHFYIGYYYDYDTKTFMTYSFQQQNNNNSYVN